MFTKFTANVENVQALNDRPNANTGLTADQVKAVFDQAGSDIKDFINNTLTPELDSNSGVNLGIVNVMSYYASGLATTSTGSITTGLKALTVASVSTFSVGHGISIAGAGAAGALLVTSISAINGLVITLVDAASTTVVAAVVSHDDTASFVAAVAAINAAGGGVLCIPSGTYLIGEVDLCNNIEVYGNKFASILYMRDGTSMNLFRSRLNQNINIHDLTFNGNKANNPYGAFPDTASQGIFLQESQYTSITNCVFIDCHRAVCVAGNNTTDAIIDYNYFKNCDYGTDNYGIRMSMSNNICEGTVEIALQLEPTVSSPYINYESGNQDDFVGDSIGDPDTYGTNVKINGNIINGGKYGIIVHKGSYDTLVQDNIITAIETIGVYVKSNTTRVNVHNNIIRYVTDNPAVSPESPWSPTGAGIVFETCNASAIGNTIEFCHTGIYVDTPYRVNITDNKISRIRTTPICIYRANRNTVVNGNVCFGSPTYEGIGATYFANGAIIPYECEDSLIYDNTVISDDTGRAYAAVYFRNSGRIREWNNEGVRVRNRIDIGAAPSASMPGFSGSLRRLLMTNAAMIPTYGFHPQGTIAYSGLYGLGRPFAYVATTAGGSSSASWASATVYARFICVKTAAGRIIQADVDGGTSGATTPDSLVFTDGTATWKMSTGGGSTYRASNTVYASGNKVLFSDQLSYECVTAGTSGATEPEGLFVDNDISWRYIGESEAVWSVVSQQGYRTHAGAPTETPYFIGEELLDTTNNKWYKSKGTASSSDWLALN